MTSLSEINRNYSSGNSCISTNEDLICEDDDHMTGLKKKSNSRILKIIGDIYLQKFDIEV